MSATDKLTSTETAGPVPEPRDGTAALGPQAHPAGRSGRAARIAVVVTVAIVAGIAAFVVHARLTSVTPPVRKPTVAITLPSTLAGFSPVTPDSLTSPAWVTRARDSLGTTAFAARTYGPSGSKKTFRVVAARTDLTGKFELAWAHDAGAPVGDNRCTQNVQFAPGAKAGVRPTVMICWRTTPTLSAYTVEIDPASPVKDSSEAAAVLDAAWVAAAK